METNCAIYFFAYLNSVFDKICKAHMNKQGTFKVKSSQIRTNYLHWNSAMQLNLQKILKSNLWCDAWGVYRWLSPKRNPSFRWHSIYCVQRRVVMGFCSQKRLISGMNFEFQIEFGLTKSQFEIRSWKIMLTGQGLTSDRESLSPEVSDLRSLYFAGDGGRFWLQILWYSFLSCKGYQFYNLLNLISP